MNLQNELFNSVCQELGYLPENVNKKFRKRDLVYVRGVYYYITNLLTSLTLDEISEPTGQDHSTVIFGINRTTEYLKIKQYVDIQCMVNRCIPIAIKIIDKYRSGIQLNIHEEIEILKNKLIDITNRLDTLENKLKNTENGSEINESSEAA